MKKRRILQISKMLSFRLVPELHGAFRLPNLVRGEDACSMCQLDENLPVYEDRVLIEKTGLNGKYPVKRSI